MFHLKSRTSKSFKKDLRLMIKRGKNPNKLHEASSLLLQGLTLPEKFKDHALRGQFEGYRDCHLEPDWLLIYRVLQDEIIFERTGTHSDLFKK